MNDNSIGRVFVAIFAVGMGIALIITALTNVPWLWYIAIPLVVAAFVLLIDYFGPLGIAYLRLRKMKSSPVETVREEWSYDLYTHYTSLYGRNARWRFVLQPYSHLVYEMACKAFYGLQEPVRGNTRYREWFGAEVYPLLTVILHDDDGPRQEDEEAEDYLYRVLHRMMAANIQDYPTFYGYCASAGTEAALIAFEHDLPIDYAKELAG